MNFDELPRYFAERPLRKRELLGDPIQQLLNWFDQAKREKIRELNAMALATATLSGKPSCRTVLLKKIDERGLIFFTNYESRKALELEENPYASGVIFWKESMRQIVVEGVVEKLSANESALYFSSRPRGSQLAAWASRQDLIVSGRESLENAYEQALKQFENGKEIPLPPYWGGFLIIPSRFEFWQGGKERLHDRFQYVKIESGWKVERLSP